jgi:hypothetical protein
VLPTIMVSGKFEGPEFRQVSSACCPGVAELGGGGGGVGGGVGGGSGFSVIYLFVFSRHGGAVFNIMCWQENGFTV